MSRLSLLSINKLKGIKTSNAISVKPHILKQGDLETTQEIKIITV